MAYPDAGVHERRRQSGRIMLDLQAVYPQKWANRSRSTMIVGCKLNVPVLADDPIFGDYQDAIADRAMFADRAIVQ